jgi:hypothetical protein
MCTVRSTDNNKQKLTRSTNPNKTYRISNAFTRLVSRLSYSSQVTHLVRVFSQVFDETTSLWLHASNSSGGKLRSKHGRFVVKGRGGDFPEANRAHVETDTQRRWISEVTSRSSAMPKLVTVASTYPRVGDPTRVLVLLQSCTENEYR